MSTKHEIGNKMTCTPLHLITTVVYTLGFLDLFHGRGKIKAQMMRICF